MATTEPRRTTFNIVEKRYGDKRAGQYTNTLSNLQAMRAKAQAEGDKEKEQKYTDLIWDYFFSNKTK